METIKRGELDEISAQMDSGYLGKRRFAFAEIFNGIDPEVAAFLLGLSTKDYSGQCRRNAVANIFDNFDDRDLDNLSQALESMNIINMHEHKREVDSLKRIDSWADRYICVRGSENCDDQRCEYHVNKRRSGHADIFDGEDAVLVQKLQQSIPTILKRCNSWFERYSCKTGHINCFDENCELTVNKRRSAVADIHLSQGCEHGLLQKLKLKQLARRNSFPYVPGSNCSRQNCGPFGTGDPPLYQFKDVQADLNQRFSITRGKQARVSSASVLEWERSTTRNGNGDFRNGHKEQGRNNGGLDDNAIVLEVNESFPASGLRRNQSWIDRYETVEEDVIHVNKRRSGKPDIFHIAHFQIGEDDDELKFADVTGVDYMATDDKQGLSRKPTEILRRNSEIVMNSGRLDRFELDEDKLSFNGQRKFLQSCDFSHQKCLTRSLSAGTEMHLFSIV